MGRLVTAGVALGLIACMVVLAASPSSAQEQRRPRTLLDFLFRGNSEPEPVKKAPVVKNKNRSASGKKSRTAVQSNEPAPVAKLETARSVLVVGDFLGSGLAEGLGSVFAQNASFKVIDRSKGSSGFVRSDFFDWPNEIAKLVETEKPLAVVVMLGSNDRQQMKVGDTREQALSENWIKEYGVRTDALAGALKKSGVPFLWVGLPPFKSSKMTSDVLALNDIYRNSAEKAGGGFVDIWDGFADENGAYVGTGPDINGQPAKLRSSDGINITTSGKRKVAFYVEKPLNKILGIVGGAAPAPGVPLPGQLPSVTPEKTPPASIDRTPPMALNDPELDGGGELLGATVTAKGEPATPGQILVINGVAPVAPAGRADDFGAPVAAQLPIGAAPETTTAINR